jgi:4-hydroxy-4-methyl-2-oxoglutarate aldolase
MQFQCSHWLVRLPLIVAIASVPLFAQLSGFSKEDLIKYTAGVPYERFEDGRPKVPDEYIEALKNSSSEMVWGPLRRAGYENQWVGGWQLIQPDKKLVGRVFTAQFMPVRPDVNDIIEADANANRARRVSNNQRVINMLQPGDVLVVDLFGKIENGTFVGDNLAAAVFAATGNGFVIDGAARDLDGIYPQGMPGYVRGFHVSAIGDVMLTGVNIPIRIGNATVMPGDVVLGDREGLTFIPAGAVADVARASKITELHDVWTKAKFATGQYKSSELYPRPSDPALIKEFEDWRNAELARLGMEPPAPSEN